MSLIRLMVRTNGNGISLIRTSLMMQLNKMICHLKQTIEDALDSPIKNNNMNEIKLGFTSLKNSLASGYFKN